MGKQLETRKSIPVMLRGDITTISLANAPRFFENLRRSIIKHGDNVAHGLAEKNIKDVREVLKADSRVRPNAEKTLLYFLNYKKASSMTRLVVADGEVSGMFEKGVKRHEVSLFNPKLQNRQRVKEWIDINLGNKVSGFIVGKPGTVFDQRNSVMFMGKAYDKTMKEAPTIIDTEFSKL